MGRSDKLVKNISFIVIGNIGSKLMGFFMLPFYTNWLSPADYGTTDLLIVYANLLLNVVACDMSDAIYIYPVGATKQKVCNYYSTGFIFQFLCSIICMFVFWGISYLPMKNVFIDNIWFIYGILILIFFKIYTGLLSRYQPNVCVQFYRYCTDDNDSISFFSFDTYPRSIWLCISNYWS